MSTEDELELSDLLTKTLELNGCLPRLRAELRASVFLALDEDLKVSSKQPLLNTKVKSYLSTEDGPLMFCLVQEFLDFFNLDITASVFGAESYLGTFYKYEGRQKITRELNLKNCTDDEPLISSFIKLMKKCSTNDNDDVPLVINGDILEKTDKNTEKQQDSSFNGTYIVNNDLLLHDSNSSSSSNKTAEETVNTPDDKMKKNGTLEELNKSTSSSGSGGSTSGSPQSKVNSDVVNSKTPSPPSSSSDKLVIKSPKNLYLDLPPIQLNKNRNNSDLLPSLCTKDLKEKLNSKEQEFGFDNAELEYEEDFVSSVSSDMEISARIRNKLKLNDGSKSNSTSNHSRETISMSLRNKEVDESVISDKSNKSANSTIISENLETNSTSSSTTNSNKI